MSAGHPSAAPAPDRFNLNGRSHRVDARINAVRRDLVDIRFAGDVFAPHYASSVPFTAHATMPIRSAAAIGSPPLSELLAGDAIEIFEIADHRAWGRSLTDSVVGYVDVAGLAPLIASTHLVTAVSTPLLARPDHDALVAADLPMGAKICATHTDNGFLQTAQGFVATGDACALDSLSGAAIDVAQALIGAPWRASGRSGAGVDGTGLLFLAFQQVGVTIPRFLDLQRVIGNAVNESAVKRGDLLFVGETVAIVADADMAIHAVEGRGVVRDPIADIVAVGGVDEGVVEYRRLS